MYFMTFLPNTMIVLLKKMKGAFALLKLSSKASHIFFSKKYWHILDIYF